MNKIKIICELAALSGYNEETKAQYKKLSLKFLRSLAKKLSLPKGTYSIRFNPGGIAVSGDAILHHDKFYISFGGYGAYWRECNGQKDYSGKVNRWIAGFAELSEIALINEITAVIG